MPPVSPLQVTVVTLPEPEHAPNQEYEVMADPPVAFGDHVQVNSPEVGRVGARTDGAKGEVNAVPTAVPTGLSPLKL